MRKLITPTLWVWFFFVGATLGGEPEKKFPDPSPRKDSILKLFADEFVPISPGKAPFPQAFVMGSEKAGDESEPATRTVTLKERFAMAKYEVTQELYHVVMGTNPAKWQGLRNSVEMVSRRDAIDFCAKVTEALRSPKLIGPDEFIRLPSEPEWEYCCRAGTTTAFSFGDDIKELGKYAWYKDNSKGYDPPVGKKMPNAWGLYDMHGYVWEWCSDPWRPKDKDGVVRGGGYATPAPMCRSAYRKKVSADERDDTIGFRCVKAKMSP